MINIKLIAAVNKRLEERDEITLANVDGEIVARFTSLEFFYVVTGFRTVEEFNDKQVTKFLMTKRNH